MKERILTVNGVAISFVDTQPDQTKVEQSNTPLVLIHGMACSNEVWTNQIEYFRHKRRVIAFDLRGHGKSSPPVSNDFSPVAYANDIVAALTTLEIDKVILVGHSYGSLVTIAATANFSYFIQKLILVDPSIDNTQMPEEEFKALIEPMQKALAGEEYRPVLQKSFSQSLTGAKPQTLEYINAQLESASKNQLLGTSKELFTFPAAVNLKEIIQKHQIPVSFIIAASNNHPYSLSNLVDQLPVETIPDTSHWLMLDKPELFNTLLEKVINEK